MSDWIKACSVDEVGDGQLFSFDHKDKRILLANLKGKFFATDLICTHAEADLSTGFLTDEGVRCPLHLSVFNLENGKPQNPPADEPLKTYNVKIQQNEIYVEI
ncbi:MAG: non-heme iron oxygenase ferredoxin subunit [Crenarchaeota archaeon]|nr:MAG: non-heme iron oxygenase ferredoxin subunit [Thermoproteota archaeon]RDJ34312.1 MAG: non-heme iron oxygenase ferredoxin subunit [Thermoproteota archaeon]RDJ37893.1 MAG: non-heme iron oxygenase ferredoxin subunit [Thermoproteota archaeon]RDJ39320.1 MAG: non-heme iron oxygenase ferredoxin subunit [Thermoproteota archaeon]